MLILLIIGPKCTPLPWWVTVIMHYALLRL